MKKKNGNTMGDTYKLDMDLLYAFSYKSLDNVFNYLFASEKYKINPNYSGSGFKIFNYKENIVESFSKAIGVYVIFVKVSEYFVPLYVGESGYDIRLRFSYFLRWCRGIGHSTEFHNGGQYLYDKFEGKTELYLDNLYFCYIPYGKIKEYFSNDSYEYSNLYGTERKTIHEMPSLHVLKFVEENAIEKYQPLANSNNVKKGLYTQTHINNLNLIEGYKTRCMS